MCIPPKEVSKIKMLWVDDYYDGPLSGVMEYESKNYYFKLFDEHCALILTTEDNDDAIPDCVRWYHIYPLSDIEFAYEKKWNDMFENAKAETPDFDPKKDSPLSRYYEEQKKYRSVDLSLSKVVGWFRDS